ncbi:MAG TPA: 4-(cytidine 5'-diphospho)-2-C-methyl-D-erythritol kinase [Dissulfurispiraceae bacterium]
MRTHSQACPPPRSAVVLRAPAKINWSLYVLNKRDDGFHNILTLMQCVGLYDILSFRRSGSVEVIADMDIPMEQNLVFKAAVLLRDYAGVREGAEITLEKEIPSGAGLGGGSSDAASALLGLNELWGLGLGIGELSELGARLGSDVPFFFHCPMAFAEGRGELLSPFRADVPYTLLLVKPPVPIPTKWAYGQMEQGKDLTKVDNKINNIKFLYEALQTGEVGRLKSCVHNDFEAVAVKRHPVIGSLKEMLLEHGAVLSLMSGSGSAVFGLFDDRDRALHASRHFSPYFHKIVETLTTGNK